jgi:hypothetical protein
MFKVQMYLAAVALSCAFPAVARHTSDYSNIHFTDPNLRECFIAHAFPPHWEKPEDVRELSCRQYNIKSLQGIEALSGLTDLEVYEGNLTEVTEIKSLPKLRELVLVYNAINEIDLSGNSQLQRVVLDFNKLESIDISKNPGIEFLSLNGNKLSSIDLASLAKLQNLSASNNEIELLDLAKNPALQILYVAGNNLVALDLSRQPGLRQLFANNNKLHEVELGSRSSIDSLWLNSNQLTQLDLKQMAIGSLNVADNRIEVLNVANTKYLSYLNASHNNLHTILYPNTVTTLAGLYLSGNNFKTLDLRKFSSLVTLLVSDNQLESLLLPDALPELTWLDISRNRLTALKVPVTNNSWPKTYIFADNNFSKTQLESLANMSKAPLDKVYFSAQGYISDLTFADSRLAECVKSHVADMGWSLIEQFVRLECGFRGIRATTGLEALIDLEVINLEFNELPSLDIRPFPKLKSLWLRYNRLSSLDVSANAELQLLLLNNNLLSHVDTLRNPALTSIFLQNNRITDMDFSGNPAIYTVNLLNNPLSAATLQQLKALGSRRNVLVYFDSRPLSDFSFPDENFRDCVMDNAAQHGWISPNQFTTLECDDRNILSLSGINIFPALRAISLHNNKLKEFQNINRSLNFLDLSNNELTAFSLASSQYLSFLDLSNNFLTDFKGQSDYLETLVLDNNEIAEFFLDALFLKNLSLANNRLEQIETGAFAYLEALNINSNRLSFLNIEANNQLSYLSLLDNGIGEITGNFPANLQFADLRLNPLLSSTTEMIDDADEGLLGLRSRTLDEFGTNTDSHDAYVSSYDTKSRLLSIPCLEMITAEELAPRYYSVVLTHNANNTFVINLLHKITEQKNCNTRYFAPLKELRGEVYLPGKKFGYVLTTSDSSTFSIKELTPL